MELVIFPLIVKIILYISSLHSHFYGPVLPCNPTYNLY